MFRFFWAYVRRVGVVADSSCVWRSNADHQLMQLPDRKSCGRCAGIRTGSQQRRRIRLEDRLIHVNQETHSADPGAGRAVSHEAGAPRACLWLSLSPPSPFITELPVNTPGRRRPQTKGRRKARGWRSEERLPCCFLHKQSHCAKRRQG